MNRGVSIVIPTYNRARLLAPTLDSVSQLSIPPDCEVEVLVIDNNCTDDTSQVIEAAARTAPFPVVRIVEPRQGLCFGRNRGLLEARYEHVAYLDDDIRINRDWVNGYLDAVERFNADCVVGPVHPHFEAGCPNWLTKPVVESITSAYSLKGSTTAVLPAESAHEVPGCNFGVRRAVALEIGGFDNTLDRVGAGLIAGGDTEFGMRLRAAGKRVVFEPRCRIEHVLTADKVSSRYLRRRWTGTGATWRLLQSKSDPQFAPQRAREIRRALGYLGRGGISLLCGDWPMAFQRELEFRRTVAYLRTRCGKR